MTFFGLGSLICGEGVASTHNIEASHINETFMLVVTIAANFRVDDTKGCRNRWFDGKHD
jgi:hypothetical protein